MCFPACCYVLACAEVVEVACGIAPMLAGETVENVAGGIDCYSLRQPLGVSSRRWQCLS